MLLVAVLAGLLATAAAARWLQRQGGARDLLVVATQDIAAGTVIAADQVRAAEWPASSRPEGGFSDAAAVQGRVLTVALQRGEAITAARLAPTGTKGGLSALVPAGKRAMTVRVNDVVGVAGFALPGTFVDVIVNTQADEGDQDVRRSRAISRTVLDRILVLAVAQEVDRDTTKPRVVNAVTLELTPRQAELLDLARSVGTLSLVLRNPAELHTSGSRAGADPGVTKDELLGRVPAPAAAPSSLRRSAAVTPAPAPAAAAPPAPAATVQLAASPRAPARHCVDIIRGLDKVTECF